MTPMMPLMTDVNHTELRLVQTFLKSAQHIR